MWDYRTKTLNNIKSEVKSKTEYIQDDKPSYWGMLNSLVKEKESNIDIEWSMNPAQFVNTDENSISYFNK